MKMIIDIGNSNISTAIWTGEAFTKIHSLDSINFYDSEKYSLHILGVIADYKKQNIDLNDIDIDSCIISSVVPRLTQIIENAVKQVIGCKIFVLTINAESPLSEKLPNDLGCDLFANAVSAYSKSNYLDPKPKKIKDVHEAHSSITIDFGTALTFTAVHRDGALAGVAICPGIYTSYKALIQNTALLEYKQLSMPQSIFGRSTEDSINTGLVLGYTYLVEGIIKKMISNLKAPVRVYATGGSSILFNTVLMKKKLIDEYDLYHTMHGLRILLDYNVK